MAATKKTEIQKVDFSFVSRRLCLFKDCRKNIKYIQFHEAPFFLQ